MKKERKKKNYDKLRVGRAFSSQVEKKNMKENQTKNLKITEINNATTKYIAILKLILYLLPTEYYKISYIYEKHYQMI